MYKILPSSEIKYIYILKYTVQKKRFDFVNPLLPQFCLNVAYGPIVYRLIDEAAFLGIFLYSPSLV